MAGGLRYPATMPMTIAHAAAAWPLRRVLGRWALAPALVVGCLTPDLIYFAPIPVARDTTHSVVGLFAFCLPVGWLVWLFHERGFRPVLRRLAGGSPAARWFVPDRGGPVRAAVLLSLLAGAASHVLWDEFTHGNGYFVERWDLLGVRLGDAAGYPLFVYKLLQHGSSILGLALLALWGTSAWRETRDVAPADERWSPLRRVLVGAGLVDLPLLVGAGLALAEVGVPGSGRELQEFVGLFARASGAAFLAVATTLGACWILARRVR